MSKRTILGATIAAVFLLGIGANGALAGEVTGTGESLKPLHGESICAFSGLDDGDADIFDHVQSYGQAVKQGLKDVVPSPGDACNPSK
jgi:hypothetical protein